MKQNNSVSYQDDIRILNQTLARSARPRIVLRTVVIGLAIILWMIVASRILSFGATVTYSFLRNLSPQFVEYLNSINKYLWWSLVLLLTLVVYFILSNWLLNHIERAGHIRPPMSVMRPLLERLSPVAKDVLLWVWQDQQEAISIKNLIDTRNELRNGRYDQITNVREQIALLKNDTVTPVLTQTSARTAMPINTSDHVYTH